MLHKDEYNQEEYNNYYKQEVEGAELNDLGKDENRGISKIIIGVLILLLLSVGGYFGYKMMGASNSDNPLDENLKVSMDSMPQSVQDDVELEKSNESVSKEQIKKSEDINPTQNKPSIKVDKAVSTETRVENQVSDKVQEAVASSKSKMTPEEIAAIVDAVMKQVNQEKSSSNQSTPPVEKQDKEFMNKLSNTEVDSVSDDLENALENMNISENTHIDNTKKQVDVYNKITVNDAQGTDSLSQLSAQISSEIEDATISSTTITTNEEDKEYSTEIKKEVVAREKEMRIIVVRKGDTLGKIAKRAYGNVMEFKRIYKANPEITRPDRIYIGQKIRIPLD